MKRLFFLQIIMMLLCTPIFAQKIKTDNVIKIELDDTKEMIIEKAAHVVPSDKQLEALQDEFIAFVHFGPNSFTRREWGDGFEDPKVFALRELDTDQWVAALKSAGMTKVVLTAKHHDGFVLWQSRYTKHGIMSTGFRDNKGDILKDLSASCAKYGLKLGVYLSPADLYQIENPKGLYGNLSKYTMRTIPRPVEGRPFENKTTFQFEVDDYNEYFLNQLFELLTEYGEIHEVWFDGAHPKRKGGQTYNYAAWKELIETLAPKAVIFGKLDVRWCGNEAGATRDTEWNIIPYGEDPRKLGNFKDLTDTDLGSRERLYEGKYLTYQLAETNTSIREGWFYRDDTHQGVRSVDDVFDIYERSVGGNSTFLLNVTPNRKGTLSSRDVEVLKETGKRIKQTYGTNLLEGAKGAKKALDSKYDSYITAKSGVIEISTPSPITINRLAIQEAIKTHGERVEEHKLEVEVNGQWREIASATNIGYKRILRFPTVTTSKIRVTFTKTRAIPAICNITAHYYEARPPRLAFKSDIEGRVTITPLTTGFSWKSHGENSIDNLLSGMKIYYTTDGSQPTERSKEYRSPIKLENSTIKAVAIANGMTGEVSSAQIGYAKENWKALCAADDCNAAKAFDANSKTYWSTKEGQEQSIAIDLGEELAIKGFAYTPQTENSKGMIQKGSFEISGDGKEWRKVETFNFGNLINDPSQRFHRLATPVKARYIRISATEIAAQGTIATAAEIDIF